MILTLNQCKILEEFLSGKSLQQIADDRNQNSRSIYSSAQVIATAYGIDVRKFKPNSWREIIRSKVAADPPQPAEYCLTDTEKAILRAIAIGRQEKQIADELDLSITKVRHDTRSIRRKYNVTTREAIIIPAIKRGDLDLDSL